MAGNLARAAHEMHTAPGGFRFRDSRVVPIRKQAAWTGVSTSKGRSFLGFQAEESLSPRVQIPVSYKRERLARGREVFAEHAKYP